MSDQLIKDRGVQIRSARLQGKRVALACSGGIGAVEVVKITREIRRHGAEVTIFCTPSVSRFITPLSLEWASGKPVFQGEASAQVEYLEEFDVVLVSPATLNTISKSALGMTDNVVTLVIANQLGRKGPLVFVPAMNARLKDHPAYLEHKQKLEAWGSRFLESPMEEDRMKMPAPEKIVDVLVESLG